MNDFEKVIRSAVDSGKTLEEIANQAGEILNKIQEEKQDSEANKRTKLLGTLENSFHSAYSHKTIGVNDVIDLMTVIAGKTNPNWTRENILEYQESLVNFHHMASKLIGKSPEEMLSAIVDDVTNVITTSLGEKKKEEENHKDRESCGHSCTTCHCDTEKNSFNCSTKDVEAIQDFLNMLFPD